MLKKRIFLLLAVPSLVAFTCGDADVTTTDPPTGVECLPTMTQIDSGNRPIVGNIGERDQELAQADCQEVFGDEDIAEGTVLVTDGTGIVDFALDADVESCHMLSAGETWIRPPDGSLFHLVDGEVVCTFSVGGDPEPFVVDGEPVVVDPQHVTTVFMSVSDAPPVIIVIEGFASYRPIDLGCHSLVGPYQEQELNPDAAGTVNEVALDGLAPTWQTAIVDFGFELAAPALSAELVPGFAQSLDDREVTVLVDGEILGSDTSQAEETLPFLEAFTASDLNIAKPGQFEIVAERDAFTIAPNLRVPVDRLPIAPVAPISPLATIAVDEIAEALDTTAELEPVFVPFLIDPEGQQWTIALDSTDEGLEADITEALQTELQSGAYGQFYLEAYGIGPNYSALLPELSGSLDPC